MWDIEVHEAPMHLAWDDWVAAAPGGHHLQTSGWGYVKAAAGWRATRILVRDRGRILGGCQLLARGVPLLGAIAYVPRGPLLASRDPAVLDAVLAALRQHARRHRILLLKIQPPVDRPDLPELLRSRGLVASSLHTAPVASVVVDVGSAPDEETLFRALHSTTRRRVRQAGKHGVTIRSGTSDDLPILQDSIEATARRRGFAPYSADYYQRLWKVFGESGHARLLIAEHDGTPLSAALLIAFGDRILYKIGGWRGTDGSPPGANELLHWTAIIGARTAGYRYYDFEGIPLDVAREALAGNRAVRHGVAFFKLGFGGDVVVYPGTYDLLPDGLTGRALRFVLPRVETWRGVVHRISGRRRQPSAATADETITSLTSCDGQGQEASQARSER
jgi:lipid II:glycine glycyltransferase (peptidoglycan interpeptide bridge formation enzyme)